MVDLVRISIWLSQRDAEGASNADLLRMLQNLLVDRSQLTLHREERTVAVGGLIASKGGVKFHEAEKAEGVPLINGHIAGNMSLETLCKGLGISTGRPVLNMTGLTGVYAIKLDWTTHEAGAESNGPSLGSALERQLGLRLELRKIPIPHLIIDSVLRTPAEN
jgi:uncharacterized protein (TIGR03435 family)